MSLIPVISGIGLCTPLGDCAAATWQSLLAGRFITDHSRAAGIESGHGPRINRIAIRVAREALAEAGWTRQDIASAALVVGTSKGPVDAWLEHLAGQAPAGESAALFGLGETAAVVGAELGLTGARLTVSAACASGIVALIRAAMMIRAGEVKRALVIAAESSLHPLFLASFNRLGVIPPAGHGCRPFDKHRAGFLLSEAAAAICLEASRPALNNAPRPVTIEQIGLGADATHLTSGDPACETLGRILRGVTSGNSFDLIHAHGTATIANDPIELAAINRSCVIGGIEPPHLHSHKGALGHSLGAAGLVAVVINCLAHRNGVIPPNAQTKQPIDTGSLIVSRYQVQRRVRRSLAIAAGFGGAVAAVSLSSIPEL